MGGFRTASPDRYDALAFLPSAIGEGTVRPIAQGLTKDALGGIRRLPVSVLRPSTVIAACLALAPTASASAPSDAPSPPDVPGQPVSSTTPSERAPVDELGLGEEYEPPFPSEQLQLSEVLTVATEHNLDLQLNAVDIDISESNVLAAVGAFDLTFLASLGGSITETPQRGSQYVFSLSQRSLYASVGLRRALETGGLLEFNLQATRTSNDQNINPFDTENVSSTTLQSYVIRPTLTFTHPLLRGIGLKVNKAEINKAKIAVTQAEAQSQLTAQTLAKDLIDAYWQVLYAHRDLVNKRRSVALAMEQLDRTNALVSAGRQSPIEAKQVEQELAAREGDVIQAENTLLSESINLRVLMGQDLSRKTAIGIWPVTDPDVQPRSVDVRAEIDKALAAHPSIRLIELNLASFSIDEVVAANRRLPKLDFQGSFTPQGTSVDQLPDATTGDPGLRGSWGEAFRNIFNTNVSEDGLLADWTLSGSLSLEWDIRNRTPKAQYETARLQMKRAEIELDKTRQQLTADVIRAANALRTAAKVMEVSQTSLSLAHENLVAEQARFDVGRSTNFQVLERLDAVDEAEANALNARIQYLQALVALQTLNGEILPSYGLANDE